MYQLYKFKTQNYLDFDISESYSTDINLNALKQSNFKLGNVNTCGMEITLTNTPTSLSNVYYEKPYPDAYVYNLSGNPITYNYKLTYKFNPYNYINNGFILHANRDNSPTMQNEVISGFTSGFTTTLNNTLYLIGGINLELTNSTSFNGQHAINVAGGTYNIDPLSENYLKLSYDIADYKPIYNITTKSGNSYIYDDLTMERPIIFTEPVNNSNSNQFGNYFVDYKNETQNLYIGFYAGEFLNYKDNQAYGSRNSLDYIPSLQAFYGYNNVDYGLDLYRPYVVGVDNNEIFYTQTLLKHLHTNATLGSNVYIDNLNDSNMGFLADVLNNYGQIPQKWNSDIGLDFFVNTTENYNIRNSVEYSAYSTNEKYTYQYVKVFTDDIKQNTTPLYSQFQVENTLYLQSLDQLNITASGFNLNDLNIIKTNTNNFISQSFNGVMGLEIGGTTLTIATIVSAVFLFKGIIALFRSNK